MSQDQKGEADMITPKQFTEMTTTKVREEALERIRNGLDNEIRAAANTRKTEIVAVFADAAVATQEEIDIVAHEYSRAGWKVSQRGPVIVLAVPIYRSEGCREA